VSGGNISDGPKDTSGNVTDIRDAKKSKKAPQEVNEKMPPKRSAEQQLEALKKRYNADAEKWIADTNHLSDKLRELRTRAKAADEALRAQLEKKDEERDLVNIKFEKYLNLSIEQEEQIEALEARIKELES
jgi:hypothetical protein